VGARSALYIVLSFLTEYFPPFLDGDVVFLREFAISSPSFDSWTFFFTLPRAPRLPVDLVRRPESQARAVLALALSLFTVRDVEKDALPFLFPILPPHVFFFYLYLPSRAPVLNFPTSSFFPVASLFPLFSTRLENVEVEQRERFRLYENP